MTYSPYPFNESDIGLPVKTQKKPFRIKFLNGDFKLALVEKASLQGIKIGKNRIQEVALYYSIDDCTEINSPESVGRDLTFYDCRGQKYEIFLYNPRYKSDLFIYKKYYLLVNYDRATEKSTFFIFRDKKC